MHAGRALGLRVESEFAIPYLASDGDAPGLVHVERSAGPASLPRDATRLTPSGSELVVDHHPEAGYRFQAPGHGDHLLSADGRRASSQPPEEVGWGWSRLFQGQVLPTAAALQGLTLLHASAVSVGGGAVALIGGSGVGKSSLAHHLRLGGAGHLTDDVAAVSFDAGEVMCHPGPGLAVLPPEELGPPGEEPEDEHERFVRLEAAPGGAPLRAMVFIRRGGTGMEPALTALRPADPRLLLAASFAPHLPAPGHQARELEGAGRLATSVPCLELTVPAGWGAAATAGRLLKRLSGDLP